MISSCSLNSLHRLKEPLEVTLGDGNAVEVMGRRTVVFQFATADCYKANRCKLHDVLYVPDLSYHLFSVSKETEVVKRIDSCETGSRILDIKGGSEWL